MASQAVSGPAKAQNKYSGDPEGSWGPEELSDHVTRLCRTRAVLWVAEAA
jgi:hypothetical protein